jgi:hypothetical protein
MRIGFVAQKGASGFILFGLGPELGSFRNSCLAFQPIEGSDGAAVAAFL